MGLPLPRPGEHWALFLDFDGTLTELAHRPEMIAVDARLAVALAALQGTLDGALAIITGRRIEDIDLHLGENRFTVAGLHGAVRRLPDKTVVHEETDGHKLEDLRALFAQFATHNPRVWIEDKGLGLALHYRQAPELHAECRAFAARALENVTGYQLQAGKMVVEVKPIGIHKGLAIERYMAMAPFRERRPVFAGDDVTDEDGFEVVNRLGGISVKVGNGVSNANTHAEGVAQILDWLDELAALTSHGT